MQPSEYEIRREVEALRDIRRRSTAGGPVLDPDLPGATAQASAASTYWPHDDSSSSSHDESSDQSHGDESDDPLHLFWVPARLHPEIAPAEFRQFLKEHARTSLEDGGASLGRSASSGSIGLGRKKSMLSRQYEPSANDGVEKERVVPIRRNRSSIYARPGPQLTISDLQKLEELAEEASKSDDPTKLRSVLRRSLSLNVAPSAIDQMDAIPDMGDDVDAPIIVPRPGQVLRRSARTKIRKPGMTGEGSHRFTATRSRKKSTSQSGSGISMIPGDSRTSSDMSSSDHGHVEAPRRRRVSDTEVPQAPPPPRPESYSEETSIYDAYVTEETEDMEVSYRETTPEPSVDPHVSVSSSTASHRDHSPPESTHESDSGPVLHHPRPQRAAAPPPAAVTPEPASTRSPSPQPSPTTTPVHVPQSRPSLQESAPYHSPSPSPSEHRREKDKKSGLFGKWGGDKNTKKQKDIQREKEKEAGFFGTLFGGKKKQEESTQPVGIATGREAAAALLGASKSSKGYAPSPSPQLAGMYARYPIHVERAIYRLSHIKLANPRRPLYEQVLISNLMFWYLGVINKAQNANIPNGSAAQPQPQPPAQGVVTPEKEQREREERERMEEQKEKQRRGTLTKPTAGTPNARRAEIPVRGPQFEMQHRVMEQEYSYGNVVNGLAGSTIRTVTTLGGTPTYQPSPANRSSSAPPAPFNVPNAQSHNGNGLYNMGNSSLQNQLYTQMGHLPPGAMPPVAVEQTWMASTGAAPVASRGQSSSPPPSASSSSPPAQSTTPPRQPRSPAPNNRYTSAQEKQPPIGSGGRLPSRSLSASAAPPVPTIQHANGKLKKGLSAHAAVQNHNRGRSEDEDVPLALWQQTQRRK